MYSMKSNENSFSFAVPFVESRSSSQPLDSPEVVSIESEVPSHFTSVMVPDEVLGVLGFMLHRINIVCIKGCSTVTTRTTFHVYFKLLSKELTIIHTL